MDNVLSCAVSAVSKTLGLQTDYEIQLVAQNMELKEVRKNDYIYHDLEKPRAVAYLIKGKVKIFKDGIGGRNQIVRVIKTGQFLGYRAYFANEDYRTSAMAFENSTIAFIPTEVIGKLVAANYKVAWFFLHCLSVELGLSDDRTINLTQKHLRGRLAEALLFLKESYGMEDDGYTLDIFLSREDLASLSNMTTSNAIRTLSSFSSEKLIAIDGRKIKLINIPELVKISKMG